MHRLKSRELTPEAIKENVSTITQLSTVSNCPSSGPPSPSTPSCRQEPAPTTLCKSKASNTSIPQPPPKPPPPPPKLRGASTRNVPGPPAPPLQQHAQLSAETKAWLTKLAKPLRHPEESPHMSTTCRKLFLDRVTAKVSQHSLWRRPPGCLTSALSDQALARCFVKVSASHSSKADAKKGLGAAHKQQRIDSRRAANIEIVLRKFKLSPQQVAEAVRNLCPDELPAELVLQLPNLLPSKEELSCLHSAIESQGGASHTDISPAEELLLLLHGVPRVHACVKVLRFISVFQEKLRDASGTVATLEQAIKEARTSDHLHEVLRALLFISNRLQLHSKLPTAGAASPALLARLHRQASPAFNLSSLPRALGVRLFVGSGAALPHLVVALAERQDFSVSSLEQQLSAVSAARHSASFDELSSTIQELEDGVQWALLQVKQLSCTHLPSFSFLVDAQLAITALSDRLQLALAAFHETLEFFSQPPASKNQPRELMQHLWTLVVALRRAQREPRALEACRAAFALPA